MPEGGHWKPERVVIIEFPNMDALNAWYSAPEYQPLIALRKQCTSDLDFANSGGLKGKIFESNTGGSPMM
jgi:uncharacterized protein (DUF1330 family)